MRKRKNFALGAACALTLALAGGVIQMRAALAQQTTAIPVTARPRTFAGRTEGEVLVGQDVVIRIRTGALGLTPVERAQIVANRLQSILRNQTITGQEFRTGIVDGQWAVLVGNQVVITADQQEAALNNVSPQRLASIWRNNLVAAVTAQVAGVRIEAPEGTTSRLVPIVSIGSGLRVGAAQVTGPESAVRQTSVVGQLETEFQDAVRIRIFVPLEAITRLDRVPQVNVTAYGDIQL